MSINNLNATSSTLLDSIYGNITISNLSATITTLFTNLNDLSTNSTLAINNLNATSTTLFTTKQNNSIFSNPFLNTSNTISLKNDNTKLSIDGIGNLTVIRGTSSQRTTSRAYIYYNIGGVSIGTTGSIGGLQINREYTNISPAYNNHVYCYNPSTNIDVYCCVAMRVQNTAGNMAFMIYDVMNSHGWALGVKGNDATNKGIYFNNSW